MKTHKGYSLTVILLVGTILTLVLIAVVTLLIPDTQERIGVEQRKETVNVIRPPAEITNEGNEALNLIIGPRPQPSTTSRPRPTSTPRPSGSTETGRPDDGGGEGVEEGVGDRPDTEAAFSDRTKRFNFFKGSTTPKSVSEKAKTSGAGTTDPRQIGTTPGGGTGTTRPGQTGTTDGGTTGPGQTGTTDGGTTGPGQTGTTDGGTTGPGQTGTTDGGTTETTQPGVTGVTTTVDSQTRFNIDPTRIGRDPNDVLIFTNDERTNLEGITKDVLGAVVGSALTCLLTNIAASLVPGLDVPTKNISALIKECVKDPFVNKQSNIIIENLVDSWLKWARDGFRGKPLFRENPNAYWQNIADEIVDTAVDDYLGFLCTPLGELDVRILIKRVIEVPEKTQKPRCTADKLKQNFENFRRNSPQSPEEFRDAFRQLVTVETVPTFIVFANERQNIDPFNRERTNLTGEIVNIVRAALNKDDKVAGEEKSQQELSTGRGGPTTTGSTGKCSAENQAKFGDTCISVKATGGFIELQINNALEAQKEKIIAADEVDELLEVVFDGTVQNFYAGILERGFNKNQKLTSFKKPATVGLTPGAQTCFGSALLCPFFGGNAGLGEIVISTLLLEDTRALFNHIQKYHAVNARGCDINDLDECDSFTLDIDDNQKEELLERVTRDDNIKKYAPRFVEIIEEVADDEEIDGPNDVLAIARGAQQGYVATNNLLQNDLALLRQMYIDTLHTMTFIRGTNTEINSGRYGGGPTQIQTYRNSILNTSANKRALDRGTPQTVIVEKHILNEANGGDFPIYSTDPVASNALCPRNTNPNIQPFVITGKLYIETTCTLESLDELTDDILDNTAPRVAEDVVAITYLLKEVGRGRGGAVVLPSQTTIARSLSRARSPGTRRFISDQDLAAFQEIFVPEESQTTTAFGLLSKSDALRAYVNGIQKADSKEVGRLGIETSKLLVLIKNTVPEEYNTLEK